MTAKEKDIRKLLELTNGSELGKWVFNEFLETIPDESLKDRIKEMAEKEIDFYEIIEMDISLYQKYFTHKEIKGLLKFHGSPVGQKIIKLRPVLLKESSTHSRKWAEGLMQQILEIIDKEEVEQDIPHFQQKDEVLTSIGFGSQKRFQKVNRVLTARYEFTQQYATSKGWNPNDLNTEQIREIQSQKSWKNAGQE